MRLVRYNVAASLDGYIADPKGEYDWIPHDPAVDFVGLFARVDTVLFGRRSYELVRGGPAPVWPRGARVYVFSRTLQPTEHPGVTVVREDAAAVVAALRREPGDGEIWLLGGGVPLLPPGAPRSVLVLADSRVYPSGMVGPRYAVRRAAA